MFPVLPGLCPLWFGTSCCSRRRSWGRFNFRHHWTGCLKTGQRFSTGFTRDKASYGRIETMASRVILYRIPEQGENNEIMLRGCFFTGELSWISHPSCILILGFAIWVQNLEFGIFVSVVGFGLYWIWPRFGEGRVNKKCLLYWPSKDNMFQTHDIGNFLGDLGTLWSDCGITVCIY